MTATNPQNHYSTVSGVALYSTDHGESEGPDAVVGQILGVDNGDSHVIQT